MSVTMSGTQRKLPDGWRWVKLGEVCELNPRRPTIERHDNAPTSFIPMEAVDAMYGIVADQRVRPFGEIKRGYTYFAEGDVLFAKITPCMQNGKHAIAQGLIGGIGFGTTEFHVLRPSTSIMPEWVHFFVRQPAFLFEATEHFTGAVGQQRLPTDYLANHEIALPPLSEQQRIAGILREQMTAVDKTRAAAEARLEAASALPAALLRQVFPQPGQRLPEGWRWVKLGELCEFRHGSTPSKANETYWNGDVLWVSPKDMYADLITTTQDKISRRALRETRVAEVPEGTILLVVRSGVLAHTLPVAITAKPVTFNQDIKAILPSGSIRSDYLRWFLLSQEPHILQYGIKQGATVHSIRTGFIEDFCVPLPPLSEQQRIVGVLRDQMAAVDKARAAAEAELETINALPAALLRRAFNGEL